jgi:hypothetical protein
LLHLSPGPAADPDELARILQRLTQTTGLLLVDWYAGKIVDTSSTTAISSWAQRYQ